MKHITKFLTFAMALTLCAGLMTACTGGEEDPTSKPGTSTATKPGNDKNEGSNKPQESKPAQNKPTETKPAETKPAETKPEETKPEESKPATTPSQNENTGK